MSKNQLSFKRNPASKARGLRPTCPHCLVNGKIMEQTILEAFQRGLDANGFMIVSKQEKGIIPGTPLGVILPLIRILRAKGIEVY